MSRLEILHNLETTLENFIKRAVTDMPEAGDTTETIKQLDDITQQSLKGRTVTNQLGNWLAKNKSLLQFNRLSQSHGTAVANLLGDIRTGLDLSDPASKKLAEEIDHWRKLGVIPKRKLVLRRRAEHSKKDLTDDYNKMLKEEIEYLAFSRSRGDHLLQVLDDVLDSAEAGDNPVFLHLAGSIIYYLKTEGYKVGPFVKRLKDIEISKRGKNEQG